MNYQQFSYKLSSLIPKQDKDDKTNASLEIDTATHDDPEIALPLCNDVTKVFILFISIGLLSLNYNYISYHCNRKS